MANLTPDDKEFIQMIISGVKAEIKFNQELTNEKIEHMDKRITDRLDKLNGKVNRHDSQIEEALIERSKNRTEFKDFKERIDKSITELPQAHILGCPYRETQSEIKFIQKYGKILIAGIAVMLFITIFGFLETYTKVRGNTTLNKDMIEKVDSLGRK